MTSAATILIVEDEAILAMVLEDMIARLGYTVTGPVPSGEEALAFLADNQVDLVLMDINLAGTINGIATAEILYRTSDIPVVFLTGLTHDPLLEEAKVAAPYGFLIKPVSERELAATLQVALNRHGLDRQLRENLGQLRESEQNFKSLANSGQVLIWTSGTDKLFDFVNGIRCEFTGRSVGEETGMGWLMGVHPEDRQHVWQTYGDAFDQRSGFTVEYRLRRNDGTYRWILDEGGPRYNSDGAFLGYIGHGLDITERKQAEKEHAQLERKHWNLQKAESLKQMAGAIAHHFNNQLGVVMGNLEMAIEDLPAESVTSRFLVAAMQGARNAAEVSGLMLSYLGQQTGRHELLDLGEVCRQTLPMLQAIVPKELQFKVKAPSHGPFIRGNVGQVQQVLTNLVTNAWEAVGENQGTVALTVTIVAKAAIPAEHRFPLDWHGVGFQYACLEVADTGGGIAPADIDKIFDPFYSSKFTGRGLGLPVVLGIVKAHGGAITVTSGKGQGCAFRVFLPIPEESVCLQDAAAPSLAPAGEGAVLLVEDHAMMREMAATMLTRLGYEVLVAQDGLEAVDMFTQHADEVRVVLSDLSMPRMDGWELMAALRRIRPDIPVILVSGHDESKVLASGDRERPQVFLRKPYQKAVLKEALERVLKRD
ncbi:ATP-binding response regulator [Desulfobulbus alkaliphilus]|uniref:ATP-binding response regulator n=1 Tax=Desulfobulbus alkaliphilus TaxID=869814 RepID=UPI001964F7A1|nr:response regulator [Desulfobulbus alkaliphilus]MBM9537282.1 response regulator [Desulfobulbus alkaliphilus]